VVKRDGLLAVEISVDGGPLAWAPTGTVVVELADGTTLSAAIDPSRTTAAGNFPLGVTITLALTTAGELGEVKRLTVASGNVVLVLEL